MSMPALRRNAFVAVVSVIAAGGFVLGGEAVAGAQPPTSHARHAGATGHADHGPSDRGYVRAVTGKVTGVNGVTTTGTCGTAGGGGTVTVENPKTSTSTTVSVTATTKFVEPKTTGATFADVCVGRSVIVLGTTSSGTLSVGTVTVLPPPSVHLRMVVIGKVTGVNGVTTTGTCGSAGGAGSVAVESSTSSKATTVSVTATTEYFELKTRGATFADVCVGESLAAVGTTSSGTFTASAVIVLPGRIPPSQSGRDDHR